MLPSPAAKEGAGPPGPPLFSCLIRRIHVAQAIRRAVSAMNGCGMCIESHERMLLENAVKLGAIQSPVRIAAVMNALATVHATL